MKTKTDRIRAHCKAGALFAALVIFILPALTWAQTGRINGRITDAKTQDPIPGANVVVVQGSNRTGATSSADGSMNARLRM